MNKTLNIAVFFVVATLYAFITFLVILLAIYILLSMVIDPQFALMVGFLVAIVLTFIIYTVTMKWATKKFELEKRIPQLFRRKK